MGRRRRFCGRHMWMTPRYTLPGTACKLWKANGINKWERERKVTTFVPRTHWPRVRRAACHRSRKNNEEEREEETSSPFHLDGSVNVHYGRILQSPLLMRIFHGPSVVRGGMRWNHGNGPARDHHSRHDLPKSCQLYCYLP